MPSERRQRRKMDLLENFVFKGLKALFKTMYMHLSKLHMKLLNSLSTNMLVLPKLPIMEIPGIQAS